MSLSESYTNINRGNPAPQLNDNSESPIPEIDPNLIKLREALDGLLAIDGEEHREDRRSKVRVYVFRGRLNIAKDDAFDTISARFEPLGYTPMLHRDQIAMRRTDHDEIAVIAVPGEVPEMRIQPAWWVHALLLIVTLITTTVMGAALTGWPPSTTMDALLAWDIHVLWPAISDGLPFSLTLLAILGTHEMGHYVAARMHKVKVTLPFFIPMPMPGSLGTLGAVIFIRSPLMNRRALFDVGIAGPLAGMVVAIPLYLIGLTQNPVVGRPDIWIDAGIWRVANPPLLKWLAPLVVDVNNLDRFVFFYHPMALAAWFGVMLTALNLLPLGQFDGGHVAYAMLGRRAWMLAWITFATLLTMGVMGTWFAWLIWAVMGLLTGLRHPPPHDDILPLGRFRMVLGTLTAVLFALIVVPVPFYAI